MESSSNTPIQDALDRLGQNGEGLEITVGAEPGKGPHGDLSVTKNLGKGWSIAGAVQWTKSQWAALGKVMWRPRD